jgi:magnesium chelatase family protein
MNSRHLEYHCQIDELSQVLLRVAIPKLNFTARIYDRKLNVVRTIADLAEREGIESEDVSEAIQYRTLDRNLWV